LLRSSHTPTLGGLAVAFALAAIGGDLGVDVDLSLVPVEGAIDDDSRLFSESHSRFVISCDPRSASDVESIFHAVPFARVGTVQTKGRISLTGSRKKKIVELDIMAARRAFQRTLHGI
jgi:phosphoribosylformylglycinamidine synthase subunit PurSL